MLCRRLPAFPARENFFHRNALLMAAADDAAVDFPAAVNRPRTFAALSFIRCANEQREVFGDSGVGGQLVSGSPVTGALQKKPEQRIL